MIQAIKHEMRRQKYLRKNFSKEFIRAINKCDKLSAKHNATYRVIREYKNYTVVTDENYKEGYYEFCKKKDFEMELAYTKTPGAKVLNFDEAKTEVHTKAEKYGGCWHIVNTKDGYMEVHEHYFETNPEAISEYKYKDKKEYNIDQVLKDLGLNREQRRKFKK